MSAERLDSGPTRPPPRRVLVIAALALAVVVLAFWALDSRRLERSAPPPTPSPSAPTPAQTPTPTSARSPSPPDPVTATRGAGPLAPQIPAGTLYSRSAGSVYAIDARTGTVTRTGRTYLPAETDRVSMVPTRGGIILRPDQDGPGLLVEDGRRPVELTDSLRDARQALPGPPGQLWAVTIDAQDFQVSTAALVDGRGRRVGPSVTMTGSFASDGNGGLLLSDIGGVWQVYPGPVHRITTGLVSSVGSQSYRLLECDDQHHCTETLLDRSSGHRTPLQPAVRSGLSAGLISPNSEFEVRLSGGPDGTITTAVVRLGDQQTLRTWPASTTSYANFEAGSTWLSPRWLALLDRDQLVLYDTDRDKILRPELPTVEGLLQLAWRPS